MKYELLQEGALREKLEEVILKSFHEGDIKSHEMVHNIMPVIKHHLETTAKPKLRLEELTELVRADYHKSNLPDLVKSICTHLGIELEEEKEEWEKQYACYVPQCGDVLSKETFKQIFKAGQACERRKGEK